MVHYTLFCSGILTRARARRSYFYLAKRQTAQIYLNVERGVRCCSRSAKIIPRDPLGFIQANEAHGEPRRHFQQGGRAPGRLCADSNAFSKDKGLQHVRNEDRQSPTWPRPSVRKPKPVSAPQAWRHPSFERKRQLVRHTQGG